MIRLVAVAMLLVVSTAGFCEEKPVTTKKESEDIEKFVNAFLSEDKAGLLALSEGELRTDLEKYFWIRGRVSGASIAKREDWSGKIEIVEKRRREVTSYCGRISSETDMFQVKADGKQFSIALNSSGKVIVFSDPLTN
jgi:hypothetical protein